MANRKALSLLFLFWAGVIFGEERPLALSGAVHVHSHLSHSGTLSVEALARKAKEENLDVLLLTDHLLARWEWGLWPLRFLIKKRVEKSSILNLGARAYLSQIRKASQAHSILIVAGAEATPFYWWSGNPFKKNLILHDVHKHILVFGLRSPEDFEAVRPNGFNHYKEYPNEEPVQDFLERVRERGFVAFWAHPEAPNWASPTPVSSRVSIQTLPYPESLSRTHGYTGFAVLQEGAQTLSEPGGLWDRMLLDFCEGKREEPVWVIGERDWHSEADGKELSYIKTVFWVDEKTQAAVLEAMREGRMYASRASLEGEIRLDDFSARRLPEDPSQVEVRFQIHETTYTFGPLEVILIRNGDVLKRFSFEGGKGQGRTRERLPRGRKTFYRLEAMNPRRSLWVFSNPVFVE